MSIVSSAAFFVFALLVVVADSESNPLSRSLLAAPSSDAELRMLLLKTCITMADILLRARAKWQAPVYACCCCLMLWVQLRRAPHLTPWINALRAGLLGDGFGNGAHRLLHVTLASCISWSASMGSN